MNLEALRKFCGGLPGATRDIKWGADEVYSVGAKMFAVFWIDKGKAKTVSFKAGSDRFLELTDLSGIVPAPYLARAHWVHVRDAKALSDADARTGLAFACSCCSEAAEEDPRIARRSVARQSFA